MKIFFQPLLKKTIIVLLFLYSFLGFMIIPYLIQSNLTSIVKKQLNADAYLGSVHINPFTFEVQLKNFLLKDETGKTLFYFGKLNFNFELLNLLQNEIKLKNLLLDNVKSSLVLDKDNTFNFNHILTHIAKNTPKEKNVKVETKSSFLFSLDTVDLTNIRIKFIDELQSSSSSLSINTLSSKIKLSQRDDSLNLNIDNFNLKVPQMSFLDQRFEIEMKDLHHSIKNINLTQSDLTTYTIDDLILTNKSLSFKDKEKNIVEPLLFTNFSLSSNKFSNTKEQENKVNLSIDTPKNGLIKVSTDIALSPLSVEGKGSIENFNIVPYQNYIKDFIHLDIKSTKINTNADFSITNTTQNVLIDGDISDINLYHDKTKKQLLKLENINLNKVKYTNNNLMIDEIILDTFSTKFQIAKDKTTNFDNLIVSKEETEGEQKEEQTSPSSFLYHIKKIEFKNGKVAFSDHSLPLNFDTDIHHMNTTLEDISSSNQKTDIIFQGVVEKYGTAKIKATTIFSDVKEKTEVLVSFENLDVRSYSPYSGKFIGRKISDGRLWLDLNYKIQNGQLQSTNNMKIKDLTLGDDVNSTDALNLPVGLAIALLEDSNGLIELDVPIVGDMNNPEFQLGGVIWKTVKNIITNIVSAPFKFLGSLLGIESEELGEIEFQFAKADIEAPQKQKLDQLVTILNKKKKLVLVLEPSYDKKRDSLFIIEQKFEQLVKSKDKIKKIEDIFIAKFGKDNFLKVQINSEKDKFIDILSSKIKKTIVVEDYELQKLAKQRVLNLQNYFVSHKLTLDKIQIKNKVINKESSSDGVFTLQLELNIKD